MKTAVPARSGEAPAGAVVKEEMTGKDKRYLPLAAVALAVAAFILSLVFGHKENPAPVTGKDKADISNHDVVAEQPALVKSSQPAGTGKDIKEEGRKVSGEVNGTRVRDLLSRATGLMEEDPGKAGALLSEAVRLAPKNLQVNFQLGRAYTKLKDYPKAISMYQKTGVLDPEFPDAFFNLGYIYAVKKDYPKAEEMYGRVVKLSPLYLDQALFNLGIVQEHQGKRRECIENLILALKANPENRLAKQYLQKLTEKSGGNR